MLKQPLNEPIMQSTERMFKGYTYVVYGDPETEPTVHVAKDTLKVSEFLVTHPTVSAVHKCDMAGRCIAVKKVTKVRK